MMTTLAGSPPPEPSGMGLPVVMRAQRSSVARDLPRPGSPSNMASLPSARRLGQSQLTVRLFSRLRGINGLAVGFMGALAAEVARLLGSRRRSHQHFARSGDSNFAI